MIGWTLQVLPTGSYHYFSTVSFCGHQEAGIVVVAAVVVVIVPVVLIAVAAV
jgi:hypothetical protein